MNARRPTAALALAATLAVSALAATPPAPSAASMGTGAGPSAQARSWVRRAASNFVRAELAGDGESACAVLYAPLRASVHGRSCEQRWSARLARLLRVRRQRALLRAQLRRIARARVSVHGTLATLSLARPLLGASSAFVWSEGCWMLRG